MASLIAILDIKGKPLIQRMYRDDLPSQSPSPVERFIGYVMEMEDPESDTKEQVVPCFSKDGVNYMYVRHSNLFILALSTTNPNAMELLLFLHTFKDVLITYFKSLEEESIRDNFVVIYELMDEMMDFGYPQATEGKVLMEYITQEYHTLELSQQTKSLNQVTNAVSWRPEGLKYNRNEVFLDVIESVNMMVNTSGTVIRSEILGAVQMRCFLSGMPELRVGLNDKAGFDGVGVSGGGGGGGGENGKATSSTIEMEDVRFHQCVRLARFENDRTISFIPPDGEFELMSYRISTHIDKPLIWVEASVNHYGTRVEYIVKVVAQFKRKSTANNVEVVIPVPEDADSPTFKVPTGSAAYAPARSAFVWTLKKLGGGKEFVMRAQFGLPTVSASTSGVGFGLDAGPGARAENNKGHFRPPITVKFEIPYFTISGIKVRYLKTIEKSGYQALPWVRYITQNGDYSLRTGSLLPARKEDAFEDR